MELYWHSKHFPRTLAEQQHKQNVDHFNKESHMSYNRSLN